MKVGSYNNLPGIIAVLMWGSLGLLGTLSQALPAEFVLTVCFSIAAALGFMICKFTQRPILIESISSTALFVGLLSGYHLVYLSAFKYAPALHVSLINYLWPALLILAGNIFFRLGTGASGYVGVGLGFMGVFILLKGDHLIVFSLASVAGYILALFGALLWAMFSNLRRINKSEPIASMTLICFCSALVCASLMMFNNSVPEKLTLTQILVVILLSIGPAGGAFFLWDLGMKFGNPALLAVIAYSAPVVSTLLMIVFGFAEPHWSVLTSTVLIALGGIVVNMNWSATDEP